VFLRVQPFREVPVGGRRPLSLLYYGPHMVMQRVGHVAYKPKLPNEAIIHPVFHVSQIKKKLGKLIQVQHHVPTGSAEQILEPESILERRMVNRGGRRVTGSDQMEAPTSGRCKN